MKVKAALHRFKHLLSRRFFIVLLILLQAAFFLFMIFQYSHLRWIATVLELISLVTAFHLLMREDQKPFKLSLIFLILLLPLFGGIFYWILHFQTSDSGYRKRLDRIEQNLRNDYGKSEKTAEKICAEMPEHQRLIRYLQDARRFPVYGNTESVYFPTGGEMLSRLLADLENAEHYIFLEYFIVEEGIMWNSILDVLRRKAADGVDVRVIYDDFGCFLTLPPKYDRKLRSYGIQCHVFNKVLPFLSSSHNNRDHRKITVIDGKIAYTGGINLADEYINEKIRYGHWKDNAIRLCGLGAWNFTVMFLQMWQFLSRTNESIDAFLPKDLPNLQDDGWVQPYTDSPVDKEPVGEQVYAQIIESAQRYLYITTPYLMVDEAMLSLLKHAAKCGVDVRIITPSTPDKKVVHFTTRSYYRDLIRAGVQIYEYTDGFIHAKSFISDDTVATVGTTNLDFRSLYFHFECGVCLYRTSSILPLKEDFLKVLERCRPITEADCKANLLVRLLRSICRLIAPLM
ncbi:MAG: cardiolipin synthase [Clostridia bacterium]|nr:cardiolipin synthase [Clostridia bacterium]MBQ5833916.1 cardiolipin synthase [Clostridia bacterium]